jgi:hypothetical protein
LRNLGRIAVAFESVADVELTTSTIVAHAGPPGRRSCDKGVAKPLLISQ